MEGINFEKGEKQDLLSRLERSQDLFQRQRILNQIFPLGRREIMLAGASEDIKGRKVRYYRHIKFEKLITLLKAKEQSARDYFDLEESVDLELFKEFLIYHQIFSEKAENPGADYKKFWDEREKLEEREWKEILVTSFPTAKKEEIGKVISQPNNRNVLDLIEKYADKDFLRECHTGSRLQCFSPYLSMSVGGVIKEPVTNYVYLELVIPDERVIPHPKAHEVEKEVLIKEIKAEDISRAYVDYEQIKEEVQADKTSAMGDYIANHEIRSKEGGPIYQWKAREKTRDCLPVSLLDRVKEVGAFHE